MNSLHQDNICLLQKTDASALMGLRLYALQESPAFFGSSFDDEKNKNLKQFEDEIARNHIYGLFIEEKLAGIIGAFVSRFVKMAHKAHVYGAFVQPACRGKGFMKQVLMKLLEDIFRQHETALASVVEGNDAALAMFMTCGFSSYGMEADALKTDSQSHNLILLRRDKHGKR